ncbi:uncharacterized protein [Spinacia oleracea]|uniref:Uncharacterized protein isoform X2 n=1 Tax=Spinacia oleracea TaxID=3562 RepID=A0ABM3RM18_SPIOL|nr:uncharacterized protein LOC130470475 isoform X2 [Spinacia oleracea]
MLDMFEREWSHRVSTRNRLYLPTYFHNLISISVGDDISSPSRRIKCSDSLIWYSHGNKLDEINQVYIPLFEQDHWFLVVIDLAAQVKYIVGSVAVNAQCEKRVLKLLNRCSKKYMNDKDKQMLRLFGDTTTYTLHIINVSPKLRVDFGVYLLRYLDAEDIKDCAHITLTPNEIQNHRLNFCETLFLSSLNESKMKTSYSEKDEEQ